MEGNLRYNKDPNEITFVKVFVGASPCASASNFLHANFSITLSGGTFQRNFGYNTDVVFVLLGVEELLEQFSQVREGLATQHT